MKGAFSITTIVGLVAAFGGLATVMGLWVEGPVAEIIDTGTQRVEDKTDYTIEVRSEERLADLAMLVYHRASNGGCAMDRTSSGILECNSNSHPTVCYQKKGYNAFNGSSNLAWDNATIRSNHYWPYEGGYPNLAGTYLGAQPSCPGLDASAVRLEQSLGSGNDMEGIFSREYFVVRERVELPVNGYQDFSNPSGEHYLDYHLSNVANKSFTSLASRTCGNGQTSPGDTSGSDVSVAGTQKYSLYFESDMDVQDRVDSSETWYSTRIRDRIATDNVPNPYCVSLDSYQGGLVLCPGDRGYVQVNKNQNDPLDEGDAGAENAKKFPYIQITEINSTSNCEYDMKPPELSINQIERTQPGIGGDGLQIDIRLTNRKQSPHNYNITMVEEGGNIIAKKGTGDGPNNQIQPGSYEDFVLNSKDPFPNTKTVADIDVDENCEVTVRATELDGPSDNEIELDIATYKDVNDEGSINQEGCLDEYARDVQIVEPTVRPVNSQQTTDGEELIVVLEIEIENRGTEEAHVRPEAYYDSDIVQDGGRTRIDPGETVSITHSFQFDPSSGCPQTVGVLTRRDLVVATDTANIDYSNVQACTTGGGQSSNGLQS